MDPKLEQDVPSDEVKALTDLPHDLQVKILTHVASNSVKDLFNSKQTCKSLHQAGSRRQHGGVLQNVVVLDQLCSMSTRKPRWQQIHRQNAFQFIDDCMKDGNLDSLFYRGVKELSYKEHKRKNYLAKAAGKGHVAARYLCGIAHLVQGKCELGLKFLQGLRPGELEENQLKDCRRAVGAVIRWLRSVRAAPEPAEDPLIRRRVLRSVWQLLASSFEKDGKGCRCTMLASSLENEGNLGGGCVMGSEGRVCDYCFWAVETSQLFVSLDLYLDILKLCNCFEVIIQLPFAST